MRLGLSYVLDWLVLMCVSAILFPPLLLLAAV